MLTLIRRYARVAERELSGVHDDWREFATGIAAEVLFAVALALLALAIVEIMVLTAG